MFYLVEVTYLDDTKQIGIAQLLSDACMCDGKNLHKEWQISPDSPLRTGLAKKVVPIRPLTPDTEATDTKFIDIVLASRIGA